MLKQMGAGYAGGSDLARVEFMVWAGGLYTDGDNPIDSLEDLARVAESPAAFALQVVGNGAVIVNAAFVAPPGHPFFLSLREEYARISRQPQLELYGVEYRQMPTSTFLTGLNQGRRHSIIVRSTSALQSVLSEFGYERTLGRWRTVPPITGLGMGTDEAWTGTDPAPAIPTSRADTLLFAQSVVYTLVWSLYNRNGDLRFTQVAEALRGHPQADLVTEAAIRFLASREDLREKVRSLTRIRLLPDGSREEFVLPAAIRDLFHAVVEDLELSNTEGHWLAEQPEPVRLLPDRTELS